MLWLSPRPVSYPSLYSLAIRFLCYIAIALHCMHFLHQPNRPLPCTASFQRPSVTPDLCKQEQDHDTVASRCMACFSSDQSQQQEARKHESQTRCHDTCEGTTNHNHVTSALRERYGDCNISLKQGRGTSAQLAFSPCVTLARIIFGHMRTTTGACQCGAHAEKTVVNKEKQLLQGIATQLKKNAKALIKQRTWSGTNLMTIQAAV